MGTCLLASFGRYCQLGELGDDAHPCGLRVYDHDLANGRGLLRIIGHYDTTLDAQEWEVIIYPHNTACTIEVTPEQPNTACFETPWLQSKGRAACVSASILLIFGLAIHAPRR